MYIYFDQFDTHHNQLTSWNRTLHSQKSQQRLNTFYPICWGASFLSLPFPSFSFSYACVFFQCFVWSFCARPFDLSAGLWIFVHSSLSIGRCDVYSLQSLHTFIFYKYATIYMFLPSIKPFYVMYLIDIITPNHIIGIIYVILYSVIIDYVI